MTTLAAIGVPAVGEGYTGGDYWTEYPTVTVTAPTGTVTTGGPTVTVTWTYTHPQSVPQGRHRVRFTDDARVADDYGSWTLSGTDTS